jgi:CHAD domain-containing protein
MARSSRSDPATRLLAGKIKTVFQHLPRGIAGDEEEIHQLRVSSRRLRVALPILAARPGGSRVRRSRRALRNLIRAAGSGRDFDVILPLLEERKASSPVPAALRRRLQRALKTAHARSRSHTAEAIMDVEIAKLRRDLGKVLRRGAESEEVVGDRLRNEWVRRGRSALDELRLIGVRYDPQSLHAVRRQLRHLRYLAECASELRGKPSRAVGMLKKLQTRLGALNDNHVLTLWLEEFAERSALRGAGDLAAAALREVAHFRDRGRALHRAFLELEPVEMLSRALRVLGAGNGPPRELPSARSLPATREA